MREATSIIEDDLSAVAEGLTSVQLVDSYNRGFTSLTTETQQLFSPVYLQMRKKAEDFEYCQMFFLCFRYRKGAQAPGNAYYNNFVLFLTLLQEFEWYSEFDPEITKFTNATKSFLFLSLFAYGSTKYVYVHGYTYFSSSSYAVELVPTPLN